jgi:Phage capsid family
MNAPSPSRFETARQKDIVASIVRAAIAVAAQAEVPDDDGITSLVVRGAVSPTSRADAAAFGHIAYAFVSSLTPVSAAAAVFARSTQCTFDGAVQIVVPALTLPHAAFVGEGAPIPVSSASTSQGAVLDPHKLATIVPLSGEMVRNSNAEQLVRQVLIENTGASLDAALFNANAATALSPAGILAGITPITAASTGTPLEKMAADVGAIAQAIAQVAGSNGGAIIVAAPREAVMLSMMAEESFIWPVRMSAAIPAGTVIGIAAAGLATAVDVPRIESSQEVALHMEDTTPLALVSAGGVVAAPIRSAFQTDSIALRLVLPATWALRSNKTVAWVQGAGW